VFPRVQDLEAEMNEPQLLMTAYPQGNGLGDVLLVEAGRVLARGRHRCTLHGLARHGEHVWTIDREGTLFRVTVSGAQIHLKTVAHDRLARAAHDLTSTENGLAACSPTTSSIVEFDPDRGTVHSYHPWPDLVGKPDPYHLNSLLRTDDGWLLSSFSDKPRPLQRRWHTLPTTCGCIWKWKTGSQLQPITTGIRRPHSLRHFGAALWWCESFARRVCNDKGRSIICGAFTRGLDLHDDRGVVGLSCGRRPWAHGHRCGYALFDVRRGDVLVHHLHAEFNEVYDVLFYRAQ